MVWKSTNDKRLCKNIKDKNEKAMRSCGNNYCLSVEDDAGKDSAFTKDDEFCPYTRLLIKEKDTATPKANRYADDDYKKNLAVKHELHSFT